MEISCFGLSANRRCAKMKEIMRATTAGAKNVLQSHLSHSVVTSPTKKHLRMGAEGKGGM
jgi:hypothetical protein